MKRQPYHASQIPTRNEHKRAYFDDNVWLFTYRLEFMWNFRQELIFPIILTPHEYSINYSVTV